MARDFRSDRIRINKVVTSASYDASDRHWPGMSFYSASAASGYAGLLEDANMLNSVGTDVGFFVSGSKDSRELKTWGGVSLFGGDVVVSGTLYAEKQVIEVDESVTGSLSVSGSLFVSGSARIGVYGTGSFTPSFNDVTLLVTADSRHNASLQRHTASILIHEQGDNDGGRLLFTNEVDDKGEHGVSHAWHIYGKPAAEGSNFDASMNFYYNDGDNDGTGANAVRITGDGKVAVGHKVVYPHAEFEVQNVDAAYGGGTSTILISADTASSASLGFRKEVTNDPAAAISLTADNNLSISMLNDDGEDKDIIFNVNDGGVATEAMRILGSEAYVGIGTADPNVLLEVNSDDDGGTVVRIAQHDDTSADGPNLQLVNANGTHASPSNTLEGDFIGSFQFMGYDDSGYDTGCQIYGVATGDWTDSSSPADMHFRTVPNGSSTTVDRLIIKDDGKIGIGTASPPTLLEVTSDSEDGTYVYISQYVDGEVDGPKLGLVGANGTHDAPGVNAQGDELGSILFIGYDSAARRVGAEIKSEAAQAWSSGDAPGSLIFSTTPEASTDPAEAMRITRGQRVGIGTNNPGAKLEIKTANADNHAGVLIDMDETGAYVALQVDSEASTSAVSIQGKYPITIDQDHADGYGAWISRNIDEIGSNPLVNIVDDNATNTQTTLMVQQDGTGDILNLFNDTTERLTVTYDGKVGIGTDTPSSMLEINSDVSNIAIATLSQHSADADGPNLQLQSARGTHAVPAICDDGDFLGELGYRGYDGNSYDTWAQIYAQVEGTPGLGSHPGKLIFRTCDDGATALGIRMVIMPGGRVGIGDNSPNHQLDVDGNIGMTAGSFLNWGDTDGALGYGLLDDGGTIQFKNSGGAWADIGGPGGSTTEVQINNAGVLDGDPNLTWDAGAKALVIAGDVAIADSIVHIGDVDTKISFTDDQINLYAGGFNALSTKEGAVDAVSINPDQAACVFDVQSVNNSAALKVWAGAASTERVEIFSQNSTDNSNDDVLFFVSGSTTHLHDQDQGRSLFAGDVTVSGSLRVGAVGATIYRMTSLAAGTQSWDDAAEPVSTRVIADNSFSDSRIFGLPTGIEHNGRTITLKMMDIDTGGLVKLDPGMASPGTNDQIEDYTSPGTMLAAGVDVSFGTAALSNAYTYQAFWVESTQKMLWFFVGGTS